MRDYLPEIAGVVVGLLAFPFCWMTAEVIVAVFGGGYQ